MKPTLQFRMAKQDDFIRTALRVPPDLHKQIHAAAAASGRTFNAEIVSRLESSFKTDVFSERNSELLDGEMVATMRSLDGTMKHLQLLNKRIEIAKKQRQWVPGEVLALEDVPSPKVVQVRGKTVLMSSDGRVIPFGDESPQYEGTPPPKKLKTPVPPKSTVELKAPPTPAKLLAVEVELARPGPRPGESRRPDRSFAHYEDVLKERLDHQEMAAPKPASNKGPAPSPNARKRVAK